MRHGPATANRPATTPPTTTAEDQAIEDVVQTPPTAHAQILLCHQSQPGRQRFEATVAKDDPLQTCPPGTNPKRVDDDDQFSNNSAVDSGDEIDVDVEDDALTASSPVTSDAESGVCSSSLDEDNKPSALLLQGSKLPKKSGGFSIDDIMRR